MKQFFLCLGFSFLIHALFFPDFLHAMLTSGASDRAVNSPKRVQVKLIRKPPKPKEKKPKPNARRPLAVKPIKPEAKPKPSRVTPQPRMVEPLPKPVTSEPVARPTRRLTASSQSSTKTTTPASPNRGPYEKPGRRPVSRPGRPPASDRPSTPDPGDEYQPSSDRPDSTGPVSPEPRPVPPEPKPEPTPEPKPEPTPEPKPEPTPEPKPEPTSTPEPKPTPPRSLQREAVIEIPTLKLPGHLRKERLNTALKVRVVIATDGSADFKLSDSSGNEEVDRFVLEQLPKVAVVTTALDVNGQPKRVIKPVLVKIEVD